MDADDFERAERARKGSPYLTAKEAAHYLRRAYKTLQNWRSLGRGPKLSQSGYHIDDLDAWERTNKRGRSPITGIAWEHHAGRNNEATQRWVSAPSCARPSAPIRRG